MISGAAGSLTLNAVRSRLRRAREAGGLIYITKTDTAGRPLNLRVRGRRATSGYWKNGLTARNVSWLLVYHRLPRRGGRVWIADRDHTERKRSGSYVFHLKNVAGPLDCPESLFDLVGKRGPQNPVYLSGTRTTGARRAGGRKTEQGAADRLANDLAALATRRAGNAPDKTEIEQFVLARLGQGRFRQAVLDPWGNACAVTGCTTREVIRASHIRPWSASDDRMRLDPRNGLPLVADLDCLFDCGLVSFSSDGTMMVSRRLDRRQREYFGIPMNLRRAPDRRQAQLLRYHRERVFVDRAV